MVGLIDFYGRDQIYLVGHDWGASVSWWTAIKYPERIKRLVIMNVPHPKVMNRNMLTNPRQMQRSWYIFFFQLPNAPEKLASANNFEWPVSVLAKTSRPDTFKPEELEEYRKAFAQPGAFPAMINWYRASCSVVTNPGKFPCHHAPVDFGGLDDVAIIPSRLTRAWSTVIGAFGKI